jgi:cold shock CspA family protein
VQKHQRTGTPFRVRLDIKVPPGHELVISRDPSKGNLHLDLGAEVRWAFDVASRQLNELMDRQNGDIKTHPFQQVQGIIERIFTVDGTGFIRTTDGREIYFHRNSVLHTAFDQLRVGMGVRFAEEMGVKGPQASSVQVVEVPESY